MRPPVLTTAAEWAAMSADEREALMQRARAEMTEGERAVFDRAMEAARSALPKGIPEAVALLYPELGEAAAMRWQPPVVVAHDLASDPIDRAAAAFDAMQPEACPDCRGACETWELDGNPCGGEPEEDTDA